jgi:hypothetical protein
MDILYFLKSRTRFIRGFYSDAASVFVERKRKIEAHEEPFVPDDSDDSEEPQFLDEWMGADDALDLLGQMSISVLAGSLQLYMKEWIDGRMQWHAASFIRYGVAAPTGKSPAFKEGWINGYREYFREKLGIDWANAGSNLPLLEETVLARNRVQHPEEIESLSVRQSKQDQKKYPTSFFADEYELAAWGDRALTSEFIRPVKLNVTKEKLEAAIGEVETFCAWLDDQKPFGLN